MLDVPAALAYPAPIRDPFEPNEDVDLVKPNKLFADDARGRGRASRAPHRRRGPERRLPGACTCERTVVVTLTPDADADVELWRPWTKTVHEPSMSLMTATLGRAGASRPFASAIPRRAR